MAGPSSPPPGASWLWLGAGRLRFCAALQGTAKGSQSIYPLLSHWASGKEVSRHTDWKIIQIINI